MVDLAMNANELDLVRLSGEESSALVLPCLFVCLFCCDHLACIFFHIFVPDASWTGKAPSIYLSNQTKHNNYNACKPAKACAENQTNILLHTCYCILHIHPLL